MAAMQVRIQGLTIEIEADDPRATQIKALLFEPLAPSQRAETLSPAPEYLHFWDRIRPCDRRILLMLADGPCSASVLDEALDPFDALVRIRMRHIGMTARELGLPFRVLVKGRLRAMRTYRLSPENGELVRTLALIPAPV